MGKVSKTRYNKKRPMGHTGTVHTEAVWGARGYIEYLRSLGEPFVLAKIQCDRMSDGSFLRKPSDTILKQLAHEVYVIALTPMEKKPKVISILDSRGLLRKICLWRVMIYT